MPRSNPLELKLAWRKIASQVKVRIYNKIKPQASRWGQSVFQFIDLSKFPSALNAVALGRRIKNTYVIILLLAENANTGVRIIRSPY